MLRRGGRRELHVPENQNNGNAGGALRSVQRRYCLESKIIKRETVVKLPCLLATFFCLHLQHQLQRRGRTHAAARVSPYVVARKRTAATAPARCRRVFTVIIRIA